MSLANRPILVPALAPSKAPLSNMILMPTPGPATVGYRYPRYFDADSNQYRTQRYTSQRSQRKEQGKSLACTL